MSTVKDPARACADAGLRAGRLIRELVHAMPPAERARPCLSILKPVAGYGARAVDAAAEAVGVEQLERLSRDLGCPIELVVEPTTGATHRLGPTGAGVVVWACMDAIDGTVKVAGLGEPLPDRVRLANDGGWAATFAFTTPTAKPLAALTIGDFVIAAVVDGNPTRYPTYPQDLVVLPAGDALETREVTAAGERRVYTTTHTDLGQSWVFLDTFQAYDRATRRPGDEDIGPALYRRLADRHAGGAFDVLRQYANLSALPRVMLGWREAPVWVESQGAGYLVVNENLANMIPSVPLIEGAGGLSVDFAGRRLRERRLAEGRTSVLHAANPVMCERLLGIIRDAGAAGVQR